MKTTVVNQETKQKEHDWSKPCLYRHENSSSIVLSNGEHDKTLFSGVVLTSAIHEVGYIDNKWVKSLFTPITTPVTILFEPEN